MLFLCRPYRTYFDRFYLYPNLSPFITEIQVHFTFSSNRSFLSVCSIFLLPLLCFNEPSALAPQDQNGRMVPLPRDQHRALVTAAAGRASFFLTGLFNRARDFVVWGRKIGIYFGTPFYLHSASFQSEFFFNFETLRNCCVQVPPFPRADLLRGMALHGKGTAFLKEGDPVLALKCLLEAELSALFILRVLNFLLFLIFFCKFVDWKFFCYIFVK